MDSALPDHRPDHRRDYGNRRDNGGRRNYNNHGGGGGGGGRGGGNNRKRRSREDDDEERPQRKNHRYEEPIASQLRRSILAISEQPATVIDSAKRLGKQIADNFADDQVNGPLLDTVLELICEQPLKIPHVSAVILYANDVNGAVTAEIITRSQERIQDAVHEGNWREFKLLMRFYACLQGVFEGDGVFPLFDELFDRAADQQTASPEDVVGLELIKIILLTLPYAMASSATNLDAKARELLEKTDIIASVQHPLEHLSESYPIEGDGRPFGFQSALNLLQQQLVTEAETGWKLACIPRVYVPTTSVKDEGDTDAMAGLEITVTKHEFPVITIPSPVHTGTRPLYPEAYFTIYGDQEIESVPRSSDIAASLIRDATVDTINILDFNRHAVAKFLIELDCFFAPGTFVPRSTGFDKLKDVPEGETTWKTEDMAIDAMFSQMLRLPSAEHKLVYYHAVITEACKLAPGAIAPTLGRAIRFLYRHVDYMDLEPAYRFLDWFTHHLSNFDFRWKWTEWTEDVDASPVNPKHAFILGAIDKEIRLSFTKRIRETLPPDYHKLIAEGKLKDTPDFKYSNESTPYSVEGRQIHSMLRKKVPETEIQVIIDIIQKQATEQGVNEPLIPSTDAYMTAVCYIGSKSLSHVLSCIDRCKERLLVIGAQSEAARRQIIQSVVDYWKDLPGTAVNIVDKLLNFTIVTPESVVQWCLGQASLGSGAPLADTWRFEMVAATMGKITNRMRQIVAARVQALRMDAPAEQVAMLDDTIAKERESMRALFGLIQDLLAPYTDSSGNTLMEDAGASSSEDVEFVKAWAYRWSMVFSRKAAVEETVASDGALQITLANAKLEMEREAVRRKKADEERAKRRAAAEERRKVEEEERVKKEAEEEEERQKLAASNGNGAANGGADQDQLDEADDVDI
ncbi:nuclear cap-binding complex, subunit NCBP1/CBP80 [Microthyrium microscopicum]|uniref:Nuclear cap-binding complex, subunit NCBP1/CBP80 n=1 Tax=Microthyrium microscopicum TaxID=703497 RepID=A0A6A6UDL9_9PEZI|nr:nuclear cap-binding complex, subunit NCBP1/CBP80 [Microthyrium microscopicum]